jgi:hypothetical protein
LGDAIMGVFVRAGVVPSTYMLTTTGRKTGVGHVWPGAKSGRLER